MADEMNKLMEFLYANNLTIGEFAKKVDVSPTYIGSICNNKTVPGQSLAFRIERVTEGFVPLSYWPKTRTEEWRKAHSQRTKDGAAKRRARMETRQRFQQRGIKEIS